MNKTKTEIDRIVELLRSKGGLSEDERADLSKTLAELRSLVAEESKEKDAEYDLTQTEAKVIFPSGLKATFSKNGDITTSAEQKSVKALETCVKHIIALNKEDAQAAVNAQQLIIDGLRKQLNETQIQKQGRTRYIKSDTKRAFIAGMIHGQKKE